MAPLPPPPTPTLDAIYAAYVAKAGDGWRDHLGASIIGKECERALWYDFRWVTRRAFSGRILRLFETGMREEDRLVRDLRRTGATVLDSDPETGRQWQVTALGGHFGGSMDAVAIGLLEAPNTWHVVEFKTHNRKSFAVLAREGVLSAKPQHAAQMQVYMHLAGITRAPAIDLAKRRGIEVIERRIMPEELAGFSECFITGTAAEVTPIRSVDRVPVGDGRVGPITRRLQSAYLEIARGRRPDRYGWLTHLDEVAGADEVGARVAV